MKLKLLLFTLCLTSFLGFSQLPNNSVAPNFTAVDLDGNTHTLQDYLDDGKTVILNVSATWCGPCWNYKQTGALSDIHYAYGEDASDEVVILYVEGDPSTTTADLNGTGNNTIGDWVSTTPFPIIDSATIANQYQITYFPTVYRICPDGLVSEAGQLSSANWNSNINANCGSLAGVDELARIEVEDAVICDNNVATDMDVELTNFGNNTITNVEIAANVGGNVQTFSESVTVSKFGRTTVSIDPVIDTNQDISFEIISINGNTPTNTDMSTSSPSIESPEAGQEIEVHIYTDNYPSEITWNMKDDAGNIVASGGPYQPGTEDQWGGGGPDAHTTKIQSVTLPTEGVCYSVELFDEFGDGWGFSNGNVDPGVAIFYEGEMIFSRTSVGDFGDALEIEPAVKYVEPLGLDVFDTFNFTMFPNPTDGELKLSANENFEFEIFTLQGKRVFQQKAESSFYNADLSEFQSGVYLLKVSIDGSSKTQKLIIK